MFGVAVTVRLCASAGVATGEEVSTESETALYLVLVVTFETVSWAALGSEV
jgi:hypothetical protein